MVEYEVEGKDGKTHVYKNRPSLLTPAHKPH
jgi:hypothetical protein